MSRKLVHQFDLPALFENSEIERALNQVMSRHYNPNKKTSRPSELPKKQSQSHSYTEIPGMGQK